MYRIFHLLELLILLFVYEQLGASESNKATLTPTRLTCEYLKNTPLVDVSNPRLAWINTPFKGVKGEEQTAYQIQVATSKEELIQGGSYLWDSEKVDSRNSTHIRYNGKPLKSGMNCWWRVRVWDSKGNVSLWSEPSCWHMGFLTQDEWEASWIGAPWQDEEPVKDESELPPPAPLLRRSLLLNKPVKSAYIYTTGLGYFELFCNGQKVSDDVLVPNQTQWGKRDELHKYGIPVYDNFTEYRVMYLCYDLTSLIKQGDNAIGAMLGNGFYNAASRWVLAYGTPRFIAQLEVTYTDGSRETIVSDNTWKVSRGPIVYDMVYGGEHYDARLECPGWSKPGFDDNEWEYAAFRKAPYGKLKAQTSYSDKVMERLKPRKIEPLPGKGNYRVDFGEEISGWVRILDVNGAPGHRIDIKYLSESPNGANSYTLNGKGNETYAARFTWFVFRYAEIRGWPGELTEEQVTAEAVYTEIETTGHFDCSNDLFNKINRIWWRSQTDNMHGSIASDCPHRERSAYTGDGQNVIGTVTDNFDAAAFYRKWIEDIVGAQDKTTGYVPNGAPWQPGCGGGVAWGAAIAIMPWEYYMAYGDMDMLSYAYPGMVKYLNYMRQWIGYDGVVLQQAPSQDNPHEWMNLGDWCPPSEFPPTELVHTFFLWLCATNASKTANELGKLEEASEFQNLAKATKDAFIKRFYNEQEKSFGKYGANIFALRMGLPEDLRKRVVASLTKSILEADGHLDTGIFGTRYFFEVLSDNGLTELAYGAMNKTTYPSFGHWIEQGATTTWEMWNGDHSRNHPMFGGGLTWFYRKIAGMEAALPGYKQIVFKPYLSKELTYASYSKITPYGTAGIWWNKEKTTLKIRVVVPVGSNALVYVPVAGKGVDEMLRQTNKYIKFHHMEEGYCCYEIGSGEYMLFGDL